LKNKPGRPQQIGFSLKELADLFGSRGCCNKGTCVHRKAKWAVDRIAELETSIRARDTRIEELTSRLMCLTQEVAK